MFVVSYTSAFVPGEWIEAHGLRAERVVPDCAPAAGEGVCPFAAAWAASTRGPVVMTTTCDQMRRMAEVVGRLGSPVFLMNVPATCGEAARELYLDELRRMGRWLVRLGGNAPTDERLRETMREWDGRRVAPSPSPGTPGEGWGEGSSQDSRALPILAKGPHPNPLPEYREREQEDCVLPLCIVGGPLRRCDLWVYGLVDAAGASIALDATELGERGLPGPVDENNLARDPLAELARVYFDTIPDAFRRPDTLLHEYLARNVRERHIRGLVLARYLWCDPWHAQLQRMRETTGVPVVEIDLGGGDGSIERARTRIESLVEMLR